MITKEAEKVLISVVMPVYNGKKYLKESIESILTQSYKNFEFIIVDDASTDDSIKTIKKYAKKDKRIRVLQNKRNLNIPKTLNLSFEKAKGSYIAIMNQDDVSSSDRLLKQINYFHSKDIYALGTCMNIIDDKGKIVAHRDYPLTAEVLQATMLCYCPISNPSVMFKRSLLKEIGSLDPQFLTASDYDYWFRVFKNHKIHNLSDRLINYRVHKEQIKAARFRLQLKETIQIQKKYLLNKKFFSLKGLVCHLLHYVLYITPQRFVEFLFMKKNYNDIKK